MNKSEKFWNRMSKNFDKRSKKEDPASVKMLEFTKKYLKSSDYVLDFACATGAYTVELAGAVKEIHGIDISSKMIELANDKIKNKKMANISFANSTLFGKSYPKESFDVILGFNILHLLEDNQKVMQRINELLKPGGIFISATPCLGENSLMTGVFYVVSKIMRLPFLRYYKKDELKDLVSKEGFEIAEVEKTEKTPSNYFIVAKKV